MARLGTAWLDVEGDFSKLHRQAAAASQRMSRQLGNIRGADMTPVVDERALKRRSQLVERFGRTAKYAGAGAAVGLGAVLVKAAKDGTTYNARIESGTLALKRFVGGAKPAEELLQRLSKTAARTPFEFPDLISGTRRLLAFGFEAGKVERTMNAVGDAVAAAGGSAEQIDSITRALGQIQAKGKVSAEELLQLSEAGIPAQKILQAELGLTGEQVANIGDEGISADKAIAALTRGMEKRFKGAATEQSKTWDGMTSSMRDAWNRSTGAMTKDLFDEGKKWMPVITANMNEVAKVFERDDLDFGEKLSKGFDISKRNLGPMVNKIQGTLGDIEVGEALGSAIRAGLPVVVDAIAGVVPKIAGAFWDGFKEMGTGGKLLTAAFILSRFGGGGRGGAFFGAGRGAGGGFAAGMRAGIGGGLGGAIGGKLVEGIGDRLNARGGKLSGKVGSVLGGARGMTPANPLFVMQVGGGGLPGGGGRGAPIPPILPGGGAAKTGSKVTGFFSKLKPFAKGAGFIGLGLGAIEGINQAFGDKAEQLKTGGRVQSFLSGMTGGIVPKVRNDFDKVRSDILRGINTSDSSEDLTRLLFSGDVSDETKKATTDLVYFRRRIDRMFGKGVVIRSFAKREDFDRIKANFSRLRKGTDVDMGAIRKTASSNMALIERTMDVHSEGGRRAVSRNFKLSLRAIERSMKDGNVSAGQGMRAVRDLMKTHSGAGKEALGRNLKAAQNFIARTMRNSEGITDEGMRAIRKLMTRELTEVYGLTKQGAQFRLQGRRDDGKSINAPQNARGGLHQFGRAGAAGRDTIRSNIGGKNVMVGSGEVAAVFNRHQLPVLNARLSDMGGLPGFFKQHNRPHYMAKGGIASKLAAGGMVRVPGDPDTTGGRDKVNAAVASKVAAWIRKFQVQIGYGYDPGGGHQSAGHNVTGTATDVVPGPGGSWDTLEAGLRAFIKSNPGNQVLYGSNGVGTPYANHGRGNHAHIEWGGAGPVSGAGVAALGAPAKLKRILVDGPDSALRSVMQGSLDRARQTAQKRLNAIAAEVGATSGTAGPHGVPGGSYSGSLDRDFGSGSGTAIGFNQAAMLAEKAGLPGITYAQIARGESGLRPGAVSPDGGYGLWQMTPRVQSGATVTAWKSIGSYFNPWNNARMAKVLAGSGTGVSNYYGTGFVTDPNKHYTGPMTLAKGGPVGAAAPTGRLPKRLEKSLGVIGGPGNPKVRRKAVRRALKLIKGLGLDRLQTNLKGLDVKAGEYGQFADYASQLTADTTGGKTLPGQFRGLGEAEWRTKELETLFALRNRLVGAEELVDARRERVQKIVAAAQQRLAAITGEIRSAAKLRGTLERRLEQARNPKRDPALVGQLSDRLKEAKRNPKRNKKLIGQLEKELENAKDPKADTNAAGPLRAQVAAIGESQTGRTRMREGLKRMIGDSGSGLIGQRTGLNELYGNVLGEGGDFRGLLAVQGPGSPMGKLKTLPSMGVLGGAIFDVQSALAELGRPKTDVSDTGTSDVDSARPGMLEQLLREANQRTAVSEAQFKVLRGFDAERLPYAGKFHTGGVIPGPPTREAIAVVKGTETVRTREQEAALGGVPQIIINGNIVQEPGDRRDPVEVVLGDRRFPIAVEQATRRQARGIARRLPGRAGT